MLHIILSRDNIKVESAEGKKEKEKEPLRRPTAACSPAVHHQHHPSRAPEVLQLRS